MLVSWRAAMRQRRASVAVGTLLALLALSPGTASAQAASSGPSLPDTLAWLTKTLNDKDHGSGEVVRRYPSGSHSSDQYEILEARFEGRSLLVHSREHHYMGEGMEFENRDRARVDLSALDPTRVALKSSSNTAEDGSFTLESGVPVQHWVQLSTTNGLKAVGVDRATLDGKQLRLEFNSIAFAFRDREMAERVQRAFAHAIRLSGGKPSAKDVF